MIGKTNDFKNLWEPANQKVKTLYTVVNYAIMWNGDISVFTFNNENENEI
jgi:hypothetical protein